MYKSSPLSTQQIEELRTEINKILQENMQTFEDRIASTSALAACYNLDSLYEFSEQQYDRMRRLLQNLSTFAFMIMSNFQMLWEEVHHRDDKIAQLRQTFSEATSYIEELKCENEDIKNKLSQAETYIEWVEQQKQYLDAIYDSKGSTLTVPACNAHNMNRCVSESSLRWSRPQKKSVNYEKLKDYIQNLKHEKNELQKQYSNLLVKLEIRNEENKKANLIIQYLVQSLKARKSGMGHTPYFSIQHRSSTKEVSSEQIYRLIEKSQQINSTTSLDYNLQLLDIEESRMNNYHYIDTPSHLAQQAFRQSNRSIQHVSSLVGKETKEVEIGTESQLINNPTVETQTEDKENKSKQEQSQFKISIRISGVQDKKQANLEKIIKQLHLEQQLESKLQQRSSVEEQCKLRSNLVGKRKPSLFDYYCQKLVSNRIKKYYFTKPDHKLAPQKSVLAK